MNTSPKRVSQEFGIEGIRGFAALCVLYTHFLWSNDLDPGVTLPSGWQWFEASQGAVLLFFLLSGYVIGLTNSIPFSRAAFIDYLRRRAIRVIPLCWLGIGLAVLVRPVDPLRDVVANLCFLQNDLPYGSVTIPAIRANTNVWTLNFEALYYLGFVFIWWKAHDWRWWAVATAVASVVGWALPSPWCGVMTGYAVGGVFWLIGLGLSRMPKPPTGEARSLPWPSMLLLWFVVWQDKPLWHVCQRFSLLPTDPLGWVNYSFYDFLPACVTLLFAASGRRARWTTLCCYAGALIPIGYQIWSISRGRGSLLHPSHSLIFTVLACALWRFRPDGARSWGRLAAVGSISYGIYILQRPVQWWVRDATWLPTGMPWTFALRLALALGVTLVVAWWAEKRLQPYLRRLLQPKRPVPVVIPALEPHKCE